MGNKKLNQYLWNRNLEPNPEVAKRGLLQTARRNSRYNIEASESQYLCLYLATLGKLEFIVAGIISKVRQRFVPKNQL